MADRIVCRARVIPLAGMALIVCSAAALAAKPALWRHSSKADFEKGRLQDLVVGRDGEVTIGRDVSEFADLACGSVWKIVRTPQGKLFAATALPGQVAEIEPTGQTRVVWKHDEAQAFSLAALADGSLVVGTGPEGIIWKIAPDGQATEFCRTERLYVWSLVAGNDGNVYAATGPEGEILKIDAAGQASVLYKTGQPHVLALEQAADGTLVAGTDGDGIVLAIDSAGEGRIVFDPPESEVRSLLLEPDGTIALGTAAAAGPRPNPAGGAAPNPPAAGASPPAAANGVYRIATNGGVRKVLAGNAMVYSLARLAGGDGIAGTGNDGILYMLDEDGRGERQLARLDTEAILSLLPLDDGRVLMSTGNPGKLFALSAGHVTSGTLLSPALDGKLIAQFGAMQWRADLPQGTGVTMAVRSGHTETPDETWSHWSGEESDPDAARAQCPPGRFLQYRLTLSTSRPDATPLVRSVTIRYSTANQPPSITKLTVPHMDEGDGKQRIEKLKLDWTAGDPNEDDLSYHLAFKKPTWQTWVPLKNDLTANTFEWDVTGVPEGIYQVRLEATDLSSQGESAALSASLTSEPFVIDRVPPKVEIRQVEATTPGTVRLEVEAHDERSPLALAAYAVDGQGWTNLFPSDRLFDSTRERLQFEIANSAPGTHVVVVKVLDATGHTGAADLVYEIPPR